MKKKLKSLPKLKEEIWHIFSRYIRLRDCLLATGSPYFGECISCGEPKPYRELDAGHFVPKHNNNYFSERGVHAQCRHCNSYLHGNQLGYRRGLVELYGEEITKELEVENQQIKKFTRQELEELKASLKERIKTMEVGNES